MSLCELTNISLEVSIQSKNVAHVMAQKPSLGSPDCAATSRLPVEESPLEYPISNWQTGEIFLISRTISPRRISLAGACHLINQLEQCKRRSRGRVISHARRATRSSAPGSSTASHYCAFIPQPFILPVSSEAASSCGPGPGRVFVSQTQTCLRSKRDVREAALVAD